MGLKVTNHRNSCTEHVDFMREEISAGVVGKDQPFTVKVDEDTLTQTGTLSNGTKSVGDLEAVN